MTRAYRCDTIAPISLLPGREILEPSGTGSISGTVHGDGYKSDGSTGYLSTAISESAAGNIIILALFESGVAETATKHVYGLGSNAASSGAYAALHTGDGAAGTNIRGLFRTVDSGFAQAAIGLAPTQGDIYACAWVLQDRFAANNRLYVNGTSYSASTDCDSGGSTLAWESVGAQRRGTVSSYSDHITAFVSTIRPFGDATTIGALAEYAKQWTLEPERIFAPRRIWVPVSGGGSSGPVGLAAEADAAFSPGGVAGGSPGLASEANASLSPGGVASGAIGFGPEADSALGLTGLTSGPVGLAVEASTAFGLGSGGQDIGMGAEADTAFGLSGIMFGPIGLAQESDAAVSPGGDAQPSVAGGGGDSMLPRRKRRYVVNDGERLLVFDSQRDAVAAQARIDEARSAASRAIEHAKRPAAKARISRRAADVALSAFPPIVPIETVGPVELAAAMDFDASGALRALVHQQAEAAAVYEALEQARDEDDIAALLEYA